MRPRDTACSNLSRWIAGDDMQRRNVFHHHGASADDGASANRRSRTDERFRTDPCTVLDDHRRLQQRQSRVGKVMRASTYMRSVRKRRAGADIHLAQAIDEYILTDGGPVPDLDIPRHVDASGRIQMHFTADLGTKQPQHHATPGEAWARAAPN